ncbi:MAG: cytochrome C [Planctomycetes bacterium]|nr:cytochrome C [Planctomycetota bacterium]
MVGICCLVAPQIALSGPEPKDYSKGCNSSGCHDGYGKKPVIHNPVENGACDSCHEAKKDAPHAFRLKSDGIKICTECHEEEKFKGKVVHAPVTQGQCTACHDPHASQSKSLIKTASIGEACKDCHSETFEKLTNLHGPVAAGECMACHAPHVSDLPSLLRAADPPMCVECHSDISDRLVAAKHKHPPVEKACLSCHQPHGASNPMMLKATPPKLCADCHEEILTKSNEAKCKHSPASAEGGCVKCHNPHASDGAHLAAADPPSKMCLSCHDKVIKTGDRSIASIAERLKTSAPLHGPIQNGECTPCHDPHGASQGSLLTAEYATTFYSAFSADAYKLCFECHEAEAFTSRDTDKDTGFRNGKQNLHFVHVNKSFKGRTCRVCHDPHASQNEKHIVESVKFGKWEIPLNYRATQTGGSCASGCHSPYRYDRESAVSNIPQK